MYASGRVRAPSTAGMETMPTIPKIAPALKMHEPMALPIARSV